MDGLGSRARPGRLANPQVGQEELGQVLFRKFIRRLKSQGVIRVGTDGRLEFDDVVEKLDKYSRLLLSDEIRHAVRQVTQA